eukprot:6213597-Pleurochrysis_carterae.AAC.3
MRSQKSTEASVIARSAGQALLKFLESVPTPEHELQTVPTGCSSFEDKFWTSTIRLDLVLRCHRCAKTASVQ